MKKKRKAEGAWKVAAIQPILCDSPAAHTYSLILVRVLILLVIHAALATSPADVAVHRHGGCVLQNVFHNRQNLLVFFGVIASRLHV